MKDKAASVSIDSSIATAFNLRAYASVMVNIVPKENVTLDSVELIFKDQYLSRSVMWRMKSSLVNSCVYLNKKIEFCGIRSQVFEVSRCSHLEYE